MHFNPLRLYIVVTSTFLASISCKHREDFSTPAANPETASQQSVPDERSLYLQGGTDFQGGVHLLHRDDIYHSVSIGRGEFNLERIKVTKPSDSNGLVVYTLFGKEDSEEGVARLSTLYIPKNKTWRGKEREQVGKFLKLCAKQDGAFKTCKLQLQAVAQGPTPKGVVLQSFDGSLSLDTSTSLEATWLVDMGLGYEIVKGTAFRKGGYVQISSDVGTYNTEPKNLIGYFVTKTDGLAGKTKTPKSPSNFNLSDLTREDCLRGGTDFAGGTHLAGKKGLLHNPQQNSFTPQPIDVIEKQTPTPGPNRMFKIATASGDEKVVHLSSLYIPKTSTSIDTPSTVVLDFLNQCKNSCFLKREAYDSLSTNAKNTTLPEPHLFTSFAFKDIGMQSTPNGVWLVDMGMGYEIIKGPFKRLPSFLNITNTDSRVYNVRSSQLIGYSIPN